MWGRCSGYSVVCVCFQVHLLAAQVLCDDDAGRRRAGAFLDRARPPHETSHLEIGVRCVNDERCIVDDAAHVVR